MRFAKHLPILPKKVSANANKTGQAWQGSHTKSVRQHLGLKPGADLQLEEKDEKIILSTLDSAEAVKVKAGVLVFSGKADEDILSGIENLRRERIRHLSLK